MILHLFVQRYKNAPVLGNKNRRYIFMVVIYRLSLYIQVSSKKYNNHGAITDYTK